MYARTIRAARHSYFVEETIEDRLGYEIDRFPRKIVNTHGLQPFKAADLAPAWHTDADLTRPFEAFADLSRSRSLGFHGFRKSTDSFFEVFDKLRSRKIIP